MILSDYYLDKMIVSIRATLTFSSFYFEQNAEKLIKLKNKN